MDTLELGNAVIDDLKDADKKIGKKTGMAAAKIGGRWAGAAIGAEIGAAAGIIAVMLIPLLVVVSIFNTQSGFIQEVTRSIFDGGPISTDIDAEFSKAIEEMLGAFEKLD